MIVVAKLKAKEGSEGEMERLLGDMIPKVEAEEGTLIYTLQRHKKDPTVFLVYEKYKDKDAFKFHSTTPYIKELFEAMGPLLAGQPEIDFYEELAAIKR